MWVRLSLPDGENGIRSGDCLSRVAEEKQAWKPLDDPICWHHWLYSSDGITRKLRLILVMQPNTITTQTWLQKADVAGDFQLAVKRLTGLVAATYSPMHDDGSLRVDQIRPMVDYLLANGVSGLYVCGSTGEGMSLTSDERRVVAEAYVKAAAGRVPVIVQVGHNSIGEARQLAASASEVGADMISATCPSYFKVGGVESLVECMREVAMGAPELPFYYYHIPILTGSKLDMVAFLQTAADRIPNLAGLKFTDTALHEFQQCLELESGRFDVLWGVDEMLLAAVATGAKGAIGSTYNIAAPLYRDIINAFEQGDMAEARRLQSLSVNMIRTIAAYPFHPAMKRVLQMLGFEFGGCRLPQPAISSTETEELRQRLEAINVIK